MKTKEKKVPPARNLQKTVMQKLREIRDQISMEIKDMNYEQLKEYFEKQKTLHSTTAWRKWR